MGLYVMFTTLTDEGRKTTKNNPERIKEVDKEVEKMGAKIIAQYAVIGAYDFVTILEAPNNEAIAKVSVELGSRGTIEVETHAAIPIYEFIEKMT
ncbi:MAG: GYD domain-containing protein [Syntrophobacterales bacterium]|jgi:uncharacterized protein with GYD domain|nr:GYD domain-containing protein [Syntrophobacterales bacterium]